MMIHNLIKCLVQTQLRLWDIIITNFKPEKCPNDLIEIYYFYISQTKSSLDKIFYKVVYHHIIYICIFLVNLDDFFAVVCTDFHKSYSFPADIFLFLFYVWWLDLLLKLTNWETVCIRDSVYWISDLQTLVDFCYENGPAWINKEYN